MTMLPHRLPVLIKIYRTVAVVVAMSLLSVTPLYAMSPTASNTGPHSQPQQQNVVAATQDEAARHYQSGVLAYQAGDYASALEDFQAASEAYGALGLWWNQLATNTYIAASQQKLDGSDSAVTESEPAAESTPETDSETTPESTPKLTEDPITQLQTLFDEAGALRDDGKAEEALEVYDAALEIAQDLNDDRSIGRLLTRTGSAQKSLEQYDEALVSYQRAVEIWTANDFPDSALDSLQEIAKIQNELEDYNAAIESYQQALIILDGMDDGAASKSEKTAAILSAQAQAYARSDQLDEAIIVYTTAADRWVALDAPAKAAGALRQVADLENVQGNPQVALERYQQALSLATAGRDDRLVATLQSLIAKAKVALEEYDDAAAAYTDSAEAWAALGDTKRQIESLRNAARAAGRASDADAAIDSYQSAIDVASGAEDFTAQASLLDELGGAYKALEQNESALTTFAEAQALWQTVDNQASYAKSLVKTGDIYRAQEDSAAAFAAYETSLSILTELGEDRATADVLDTMGAYRAQLEQYADASTTYIAAAALWQKQERLGSQVKSLRYAARAYGAAEDVQALIATYLEAVAAAEQDGDLALLAATLDELGRAYQSLERYDEALTTFDRAQAIWSEQGDQKKRSETLDRIADTYQTMGDDAAALDTYQQAIAVAEEAGESGSAAALLESLGGYYARLERYPDALTTFERAGTYRKASGESEREIRILRSVADVYQKLGDAQSGVDTYQAALALARELENQQAEAELLGKLSRHFQSFQRYDEAISASQDEIAVWTALEDTTKATAALISLASTYQRAGIGNNIVPTYAQALTQATAAGNRSQMATIHDGLGGHYRGLRQYPEALENYQKSAELWQANDTQSRAAKSLSAVGSVLAALGDSEQATAAYLQGLAAAKTTGNPADEASSFDAVGRHYSSLKRYPEALDAYRGSYNLWSTVGDVAKTESVRFRIWSTLLSLEEYGTALEWAGEPVGITQPVDGATVREAVEIQGLAVHPQFERWQIDLLANGDESQATYVGRSFRPAWGRLLTLDTTLYPNGPYTIRLRVIREDKNYDEYFTSIIINNDLAALEGRSKSTENGITKPRPNASTFGRIQVEGIADHDDFEKWELDLLLFGDAQRTTHLQTGSRPSQGRLFSLDTQAYPNGSHTLRLRVVRGDSNYDEYFVNFAINN